MREKDRAKRGKKTEKQRGKDIMREERANRDMSSRDASGRDKKAAVGKNDALSAEFDDIVGVGDRLNMKLYAAAPLSLTLAPDQTVSINSTAPIYPMQLHPPLSTIKCRPAKTENVDLR